MTNPALPPLTARQKQVLRFVVEAFRDTGAAPTIREVCDHLRIRVNAGNNHLKALAKAGVVVRPAGLHRRLRVPLLDALSHADLLDLLDASPEAGGHKRFRTVPTEAAS